MSFNVHCNDMFPHYIQPYFYHVDDALLCLHMYVKSCKCEYVGTARIPWKSYSPTNPHPHPRANTQIMNNETCWKCKHYWLHVWISEQVYPRGWHYIEFGLFFIFCVCLNGTPQWCGLQYKKSNIAMSDCMWKGPGWWSIVLKVLSKKAQ